MGLKNSFSSWTSKVVRRETLLQSKPSLLEHFVFHQMARLRYYFSKLTISSSNVVNFPSPLTPVVKSNNVSRLLLQVIKFFLRNTGDITVSIMGALFFWGVRKPCSIDA